MEEVEVFRALQGTRPLPGRVGLSWQRAVPKTDRATGRTNAVRSERLVGLMSARSFAEGTKRQKIPLDQWPRWRCFVTTGQPFLLFTMHRSAMRPCSSLWTSVTFNPDPGAWADLRAVSKSCFLTASPTLRKASKETDSAAACPAQAPRPIRGNPWAIPVGTPLLI